MPAVRRVSVAEKVELAIHQPFVKTDGKRTRFRHLHLEADKARVVERSRPHLSRTGLRLKKVVPDLELWIRHGSWPQFDIRRLHERNGNRLRVRIDHVPFAWKPTLTRIDRTTNVTRYLRRREDLVGRVILNAPLSRRRQHPSAQYDLRLKKRGLYNVLVARADIPRNVNLDLVASLSHLGKRPFINLEISFRCTGGTITDERAIQFRPIYGRCRKPKDWPFADRRIKRRPESQIRVCRGISISPYALRQLKRSTFHSVRRQPDNCRQQRKKHPHQHLNLLLFLLKAYYTMIRHSGVHSHYGNDSPLM